MTSERNITSFGLILLLFKCLLITTIPISNLCVVGFSIEPTTTTTTALHSRRGAMSSTKKAPSPLVTFMSQMQGEEGGGDFFDELSKPSNNNNPAQQPAYVPAATESDFEAHIPKINSVTLVGRIGQSPEPRYFDDGKVVLRLSLAVKRKYHPLERRARNIKSGEEETDWFNLELWGKDAEYASKYVTKGARVGITGSLNIDAWVDKMTGEQRTSPKIVVKHFDILESRAEAELRQGRRTSYPNPSARQSPQDGLKNYYRQQEDDDVEGDGPSPAGSGDFFA